MRRRNMEELHSIPYQQTVLHYIRNDITFLVFISFQLKVEPNPYMSSMNVCKHREWKGMSSQLVMV
jgi:hypothetical protein